MKLGLFLISFLFNSCWSFPYSFVVKSPTDGRLKKRQINTNDEVSITELTITSQVQFRYSRTVVESLVKNFGDTSKSAKFDLILPDSAFISNFSMVTKDVEYVAEVKAKEDAKEVFSNHADKGYDVGLVEKKSRDANVFQIQTNVEPGGKVLFRLTYDELLQRRLGSYEQAIHVHPGQIVDKFNIVININESLPITKLTTPELLDSNEINLSNEKNTNTVAKVLRNIDGDASKAKIMFDVSQEYQKEFGAKGIQGEFLVKYDVDRGNQSSEIQVIDGHFVHFFTPENLKTLPKHIIFVLDVSGSMHGEKLEQLKDAMFTILDEMTENDQFDLITFSSSVQHWKPSFSIDSMAFKATTENKEESIKKILELEANGGTNINDALQKAISVASDSRAKEDINSGVTSMILFLTDGQPTEGITDTASILKMVKENNIELKIPIFSLAFGSDAHFELVVDIAKATDSHAKQIYEGSDAALQLEGFYKEISSPLLSDLKFKYIGAAVDEESVTDVELKTYFKGSEFIVSGKLLPVPDPQLDIEVEASTGSEIYKEHISICLRSEYNDIPSILPVLPAPPCFTPPQQNRSEAQNFLKNLYAFLNIQQLLKKDDDQSKEKALKMSLDNHFVTDLTSLVVIKDNDTFEGILRQPTQGFNSLTSLRSVVPYSSYGPPGSASFIAPMMVGFNAPALPMLDMNGITPRTTTSTSTSSRSTSTTPGSCKLTLFSKTYHRGDESEILQSLPNLFDFNDRSVSAKLEGTCCWAVHAGVNFTGEVVLLNPDLSSYTSVKSLGNLFRKVKSVKRVSCS